MSEGRDGTRRDTVLYVEDDVHLRELFGKIMRPELEKRGLRLLAFEDGLDAKRHVLAHGDRILAYVQDLGRPGLNGYAFLDEVVFALTPERRCLIVSGRSLRGFLRRRKMKALPETLRWLGKPCSARDLRGCMPWLVGEEQSSVAFEAGNDG